MIEIEANMTPDIENKIKRSLETKGYVGIQDFTKDDLIPLKDYLAYMKSFAKGSKDSIDKLEMAVAVVEGKYV
jgi:hypothetical protein